MLNNASASWEPILIASMRNGAPVHRDFGNSGLQLDTNLSFPYRLLEQRPTLEEGCGGGGGGKMGHGGEH